MSINLRCHLCGARWKVRVGDYDFNCPNGCDAHGLDKPLTDAEAVRLALELYDLGSRRRQQGGRDAHAK